jgi:hypothetical protein
MLLQWSYGVFTPWRWPSPMHHLELYPNAVCRVIYGVW